MYYLTWISFKFIHSFQRRGTLLNEIIFFLNQLNHQPVFWLIVFWLIILLLPTWMHISNCAKPYKSVSIWTKWPLSRSLYKNAKMWRSSRTLQSIIFPWGPDLPKNLGTFFTRTDFVGEKKVMWGKQVWGVSSVNKDTPHVHTISWLVSSVNTLILLRKHLLNYASKWVPF